MNISAPKGNTKRDAVEALSGYVYQMYQSALAWVEIDCEGVLWLEVSEDYLKAAQGALEAVQVKETSASVTINSKGVLSSIDSFIALQVENPQQDISLRYLTTSIIGKEKALTDRLCDEGTLFAWRTLAASGDLSELRELLLRKDLSDQAKKYIQDHDDEFLRKNLLGKVHFDCGALKSQDLKRLIIAKVSKLVRERGGVHSQAVACVDNLLVELLHIATRPNRDDRFVDHNLLEEILEKATHAIVNRADQEKQNALIQQALSASLALETGHSKLTQIVPRPINEVQLPNVLAKRNAIMDAAMGAVTKYRLGWIYGGAGMGKTIVARVVANCLGGDWAILNFRGRNSEYVSRVLEGAANTISEMSLKGLILDDLECDFSADLKDNLSYLQMSAGRSDVLLLVTAPRKPPSDYLYLSNLPIETSVLVKEFSEDDVAEILGRLGVDEGTWARYIHLISGGGHPQLAAAAIQSMSAASWPISEIRSLKSLLGSNPEVEEVRRYTRTRLLEELPEASRRILERLSLKVGGFKRDLVLDLANVTPAVSDCGLLFDTLVGTWVDQHANDRFYLSPLLSDLAKNTLSSSDQKAIHFAIADSLTEGWVLDGSELDAAALSAWISENSAVLIKICLVIFSADPDDFELLTQNFNTFFMMGTDQDFYPADRAVSHMLRGAQILLLSHQEKSSKKFWEAHTRFEEEGTRVTPDDSRSSMELLVYSKLLLLPSTQYLGPAFTSLISKIDSLFGDQSLGIVRGLTDKFFEQKTNGITVTGFMFLNQCRLIQNLDDLECIFGYLDSISPELRNKLLNAFRHGGMDVDMLVSGAWLREHDESTIDASIHVALFRRLELLAVNWGCQDLAICCCKYQATILNEYGSDKDRALEVLHRGLAEYGEKNSDLIRAKAKVLYLSGDHVANLRLSKLLIDSDASLNPIEKAFLGRDAAISAENEGDYEVAREYYLYASSAAKDTQAPDMEPMYVGLLADAALASWHGGDRATCIRDFAGVLGELIKFEHGRSLRTSHCHAMVRHVLLWIEQDAAGRKKYFAEGQETKIYPGCVSQPEPHKDIVKHLIIPIELAWYMLAQIECYALLNVGIMQNLHNFLPNGPVKEGQMLLISAKMSKAISLLDIDLFREALREKLAVSALIKSQEDIQSSFDIEKVTLGTLPLASRSQQEALQDASDQEILLFASMCIMKHEAKKIDDLIEGCKASVGFIARSLVLDRLGSSGPSDDFYTRLAQLIFRFAEVSRKSSRVQPIELFEFSMKILQIAEKTEYLRVICSALSNWFPDQWKSIWEAQRFRLNQPAVHEEAMNKALVLDSSNSKAKIVACLQAMLPMLAIDNRAEVSVILEQILSSK